MGLIVVFYFINCLFVVIDILIVVRVLVLALNSPVVLC